MAYCHHPVQLHRIFSFPLPLPSILPRLGPGTLFGPISFSPAWPPCPQVFTSGTVGTRLRSVSAPTDRLFLSAFSRIISRLFPTSPVPPSGSVSVYLLDAADTFLSSPLPTDDIRRISVQICLALSCSRSFSSCSSFPPRPCLSRTPARMTPLKLPFRLGTTGGPPTPLVLPPIVLAILTFGRTAGTASIRLLTSAAASAPQWEATISNNGCFGSCLACRGDQTEQVLWRLMLAWQVVSMRVEMLVPFESSWSGKAECRYDRRTER